ncbi:hypothetical protein GCM10020254_34250 [Streptomyces goshikiensis]
MPPEVGGPALLPYEGQLAQESLRSGGRAGGVAGVFDPPRQRLAVALREVGDEQLGDGGDGEGGTGLPMREYRRTG